MKYPPQERGLHFFSRGGHTSGKFQLPKLQQNPADFDVLHEFGVVVFLLKARSRELLIKDRRAFDKSIPQFRQILDR